MSTKVLRLLSGVSLHGDRHLAEVEQDLAKIDMLLDEAIKKLCTSFMAIHHAVNQQQEALNQMRSESGFLPESAARLVSLHDEINCHVGAAVTGLQFQDMTSQLIRRMALHVTGLRDVLDALGTDVSTLSESADDPHLVLDDISDRVDARCIELAGDLRSTVNQRHMESGEIELF